jgi:hypothetical protein
MPANYNGPLAIDDKVKTKLTFCAATILLFYILQKITLTEVSYFSSAYHHTSFQMTALIIASGTLITQFRSTTMLLFPVVRKQTSAPYFMDTQGQRPPPSLTKGKQPRTKEFGCSSCFVNDFQ